MRRRMMMRIVDILLIVFLSRMHFKFYFYHLLFYHHNVQPNSLRRIIINPFPRVRKKKCGPSEKPKGKGVHYFCLLGPCWELTLKKRGLASNHVAYSLVSPLSFYYRG